MRGPVLVILAGALAAIMLLAAAGVMRHRALLRAPGSFPGLALTEDGRRRRVVGRYDERLLVLSGIVPAARRAWRGERWSLQIDRVPGGAPEGQTLLQVRGGSAPLRLQVDEAVAGALRAWCEAGPSPAARHWAGDPRVGRPRR